MAGEFPAGAGIFPKVGWIFPPLPPCGRGVPRGIKCPAVLTRDSQTPSVSISIVRAKARARDKARASRVRAVTLTLTARGVTCWKMPIGARG